MAAKKEAKAASTGKKVMKKAPFSLMAPDARSVQLAGDFNSWNPEVNPLKKSSNGVWKINLKLSPGRYEYRFLVDDLGLSQSATGLCHCPKSKIIDDKS